MTKCDNAVTVTGHGVVCIIPIGCWELARQAEAVVLELTSSCFSWKHISWHVCMRVYVSGMRGRVSCQVNTSMEGERSHLGLTFNVLCRICVYRDTVHR